MASGGGNDGGPPPTDPSDPDFVCPCHTFVFEMCDQCMDQINVQAMLDQIREDQSKKKTTRPEEKTPERTSKCSQNIVEGGVLEGGNDDAMDTTPETTPTNDSAVLVSVTQIDHNKYKYKFKYKATVTAAEDPATPSTSGTQKYEELQEEVEELDEEDNEVHEENSMDNETSDSDTPIVDFDNTDTEEEESENEKSDRQILQLENSDDDNPIVVGGYLLCEDEIESDEPEYDDEGNEIVAGHQL